MNINYSSILTRSWEISKKNKWLWVYGLVLAMMGGGIFNQGWSGLSDSSFDKLPKEIPSDFSEKTSQVLGQTISAFQEWLASISPATWIILGLGVFLFILFIVIINWVVQAWAKGSLIAGLAEANEGQIPTLLGTSPKGIVAIKGLIIYGLIAMGISFLVILILVIVFLVPGLLISILNGRLTVFWVIFSVATGGLTLVLLFILLAMINIYAERLIILRRYSPWQAWKKGLSLSRGSFLPTIVMGIINQAIGCSIGCLGLIFLLIILGIPAIIILLPSFKNGLHLPSFPALIFLFFLFLIFIYANWLVRAIFAVFNFSNWNLLFEEILTKEENGK